MIKPLLLAILLATAPAAAFAQSQKGTGSSATAPAPTGNMNNPQAQSNQAGQPGNARELPSSGDAKSIPTPVIHDHQTTRVPSQPRVPR